MDRHRNFSVWVAGRRAWIIDFATKGVNRWAKGWALATLLLIVSFLLNPLLFVSLSLVLGLDQYVPDIALTWVSRSNPALHLSLLGFVSLVLLLLLLALVVRTFRRSLLRDTPLLRLLANSGPTGDLSRPWFWSPEQTVDRARVLSRELVQAWYERKDALPELIVTATDISLGKECLFTLVRPDTYHRLVNCTRMTVQLDSHNDEARPYRENKRALLTLPENFLRCILSSTALPGAFPAQQLGIYGGEGRREVRHYMVDGGVLSSPIHIAIDAGATHIISIELDRLEPTDPLDVDDRAGTYNLLEVGIMTFSTLLGLSTQEDIRRTAAWNRFLLQHPEALKDESYKYGSPELASAPRKGKRIVPLYRIAPEKREIGTLEFNGHYEGGQCTVTLRDWLRRGSLDMQGKHIWRATLQPYPQSQDCSGPQK